MEQKQEFNEYFRIILLGNNYVGKSALLHTYSGGTIYGSGEYEDTMGVDQQLKQINVFNKKIQLRIWDASGAPRLQIIVSSYFRTVDGALICFDLTNMNSFRSTKEHIERLREVKKNIPMILVGCKADLEQRKEVLFEDAKQLAKELGLTYLEVSSLKKENITEPFTQITQQIYIVTQLNKLKPKFEDYLDNYLKIANPTSRASFFNKQNLDLGKEAAFRDEYKVIAEKLFQSKTIEELIDLGRQTVALLEKADNLYKEGNPFFSTFVSSPLSNALKHTLDGLIGLLAGMMPLPTIKEQIYQKKEDTMSITPKIGTRGLKD